jgi:hypothetical protein
VYRFVPFGGGNPYRQGLDAQGNVGVTDFARSSVGPDGSVQTARMSAPGLMGGEPVPARLGGGFLFWSYNVLYRARTFIGDLEPIAPLPTNVITLAFGHDSLLVVEPESERKAYSLEHGGRVPLSPHGVIDVAGADDDRVVAIDAAGRALASIDGGKSWTDVSSQLGGRISRLHGEAHEVGFEVNDQDGAWLQPDGRIEHRRLPDRNYVPPPTAEASAARLLFNAVSNGVPLADGRVLVGEGPGFTIVDLKTGAGTPPHDLFGGTSAPAAASSTPGKGSCVAVSTDDDGLFVCYHYTVKKNSITVLSRGFGAEPRVERHFEGTPPLAYGGGLLVVGGSCDEAQGVGLACARRSPGIWTPQDIRFALDPKTPGAQIAAWVPKEDGGVAAITWTRVGRGPEFQLSLVDAARATATPFDAPIQDISLGGSGWVSAHRWIVLRDGTLRGFSGSRAVSVDARGHVAPATRVFKSVAAGDPAHALGRDESARLWQTTDYGAHWSEIARPPFETPERMDSTTAFRCSPVGCVEGHGSGAGSWLRFGWPEDPPVPAATRDGGAAPPLETAPGLPQPAPPKLPMLRCSVRGAPAAAIPNRNEAAGGAGDSKGTATEQQTVFGGRRLPKRLGDKVFANVQYRDGFAGAGDTTGPQSITHGLRGIVRYPTPAENTTTPALSALIESKAPIETMFVEPFDPSGHVLHGVGSFANWLQVPISKGKAGPAREARPASSKGDSARMLAYEGDARPVLSNRLGHADGVLFTGSGFVLWLDHVGAIHPVHIGCRPFGGYVDAHGKLLAICEDSTGGASILETDTGTARLRLAGFAPWSIRSPTSQYPHPPGMHIFEDPDSIAVDKDGNVGVLRVPSGFEPSSADDPAWLLTKDAPPVELAPWSTLEVASSPACSKSQEGYRAIVQTSLPWMAVQGSFGFRRTPGMTALVRWSPARVCLEAVEVGYREIEDESSPTYGLKVMAVARFVGAAAGGGFVGTSAETAYREAATCGLD